MPYEILYTDDGLGVVTTYWGTITDGDLLKSGQAKLASLDKLRRCRYALTDLSRVDEFNLTTAGIQGNVDISSKIIEANKDIVVAFVLPTDLEYGMGRMWQAYSDRYGIKSLVSRTRDEAEAWIKSQLKSRL